MNHIYFLIFWFLSLNIFANIQHQLISCPGPQEDSNNYNSLIKQLHPGQEIVKIHNQPQVKFSDLNGDKVSDAWCLVKDTKDNNREPEFYLKLFMGSQNSQFTLWRTSGNIGNESLIQSGSDIINISDKNLKYYHQGMRSHLDFTFNYNEDGRILLTELSFHSYGNMEEAGIKIQIDYLSQIKVLHTSSWSDDEEENAIPRTDTIIDKSLIPIDIRLFSESTIYSDIY